MEGFQGGYETSWLNHEQRKVHHEVEGETTEQPEVSHKGSVPLRGDSKGIASDWCGPSVRTKIIGEYIVLFPKTHLNSSIFKAQRQIKHIYNHIPDPGNLNWDSTY